MSKLNDVFKVGDRVMINYEPLIVNGRQVIKEAAGEYGEITEFDGKDDCFTITLDGVYAQEVYFPAEHLERG